jgi:hypothetical protein
MPQKRIQRINAALIGQANEITLRLLGDFQRRPERDDRFLGKILEEAGRFIRRRKGAADVHDTDSLQFVPRPQGVRIESANGLDLIAEEIHPNWEANFLPAHFEQAREVDVDNSAAHGEIAGHFHLIQAIVAMLGEPDDQFLDIQLLAISQVEDQILQLTSRGDRLHEGLNRCDQDGRCVGGIPGRISRDESQAIGDLLLAGLSEASSQFQGREHLRSLAGKKRQVVREVFRLIEMSADQHYGAGEV